MFAGVGILAWFFWVLRDLPSVSQLQTYHPPLLSEVFDRNGEKVGEFFKERRVLIPYEEFPEHLVQAFVSAEDGNFFEHKGLQVRAIFRAFLANLRAGKKVQGGSTITQQVARQLLLSPEKTYTRKLKEAILALRMEKHLSKEKILFFYLNQIYLGHGAYGVGMASRVYFRKPVQDLTLKESALLAGLPQAPSRFSPIYNPVKAKERQLYVLQRMVEEAYLTPYMFDQISALPVTVYLRESWQKKAPYYVETIRQMLIDHLGESLLLTGGLKIKASLDYTTQVQAKKALEQGLKELDKRQGYRGPLQQTAGAEEAQVFFEQEEQKWTGKNLVSRTLTLDEPPVKEDSAPPEFEQGDTLRALVREVRDKEKISIIELPFSRWGVLELKNMDWARVPNPKISHRFTSLSRPSEALKENDVILIKVLKKLTGEELKKPKKFVVEKSENYFKSGGVLYDLALEQEPEVEGALVAFDQKTGEITALVGGYSFSKSQFNRVFQALRQTGSAFKPLVFISALDKGYTPSSLISDAPVMYDDKEAEEAEENGEKEDPVSDKTPEERELEAFQKKWRPRNYGRKFLGEILLRNALIHSMNVPTVKIIENVGIQWVMDYARRLGIFSPLNSDYTLALGSSSVSLYEMTKVFSIIGRLGLNIQPLLVNEVLNAEQDTVSGPLSLDDRFSEKQEPFKQEMEERRLMALQSKLNSETGGEYKGKEPPFFFSDPDQVISKKTAFIMTTLLRAVIREGTGTGASTGIKQQLAGKTGTTDGYYDAWFIGYSPDVVAGVWVGFDKEKSLGIGESGARAALPIWRSFMQALQKEKSDKDTGEDFKVPEGIVFTHIDNETGELVHDRSGKVVYQAFVEGTEPGTVVSREDEMEEQEFLRQEFVN